jgi:hypothetical protein
MKGAGSGGHIARNVVVCLRPDTAQPGSRVGISMGGGSTAPAYCREKRCATEHRMGIVADNLVLQCNDVGIDIHNSQDILVMRNILLGTAGVMGRGDHARMQALCNLVDGRIDPRWSHQARSGDVRFDRKIEASLWQSGVQGRPWQDVSHPCGAMMSPGPEFSASPEQAPSWAPRGFEVPRR